MSQSYSKGISWINDVRIPFVDEGENNLVFNRSGKGGFRQELVGCEIKEEYKWKQGQGRFPANLLVSDDVLYDGSVSKSVRGRNDIGSSTYGGNSLLNSKTKMNNTDRGFDDKGTNSRYYDIDKWFDKLLEDVE